MKLAGYHIRRLTDLTRYAFSRAHSLYYCGWVGYCNLGDEAMLEAVRRTFAPLAVAGAKLPAGPAWLRRWMERKRHSAALLGGGTMIVRPEGEVPPRFFLNFKEALGRHGHGIVFGTGVYARKPEQDLQAWKPLLQECLFVGVRGPRSAALLQKIGVNARIIGDPAVVFVKPTSFAQPVSRTMGVNTGSLWMGAAHPNQRAFDAQLSQFLRRRIGDGWQVEFFCIYPGDLATVNRVAELAGIVNPTVRRHYWDAESFMRSVRHMSLFIATKLHATILAMCAGVPTLSVSYQPKCEDFMTSVASDRYCVSVQDVGADVFSARFEELVSDGRAVTAMVRSALGNLRAEQERAAAHICALLSAGPTVHGAEDTERGVCGGDRQ